MAVRHVGVVQDQLVLRPEVERVQFRLQQRHRLLRFVEVRQMVRPSHGRYQRVRIYPKTRASEQRALWESAGKGPTAAFVAHDHYPIGQLVVPHIVQEVALGLPRPFGQVRDGSGIDADEGFGRRGGEGDLRAGRGGEGGGGEEEGCEGD